MSPIPVYRGRFGRAQAERLLWRAGFGPRPGEAEALAKKGLRGAVFALTRPPTARMIGPPARTEDGKPLRPQEEWDHDHLWWLDRMMRSNQPLVERMALVWHDWFATVKDAAPARLMLGQNALFRREALGSFEDLLIGVTRDPAMLLFLSGSDNTKWEPNENYARELMELFTLGASRGYTERDVREHARALTGWKNDWREGPGPVNFRFDPELHDTGVKTIFGSRGRYDWRDSVELCLKHRSHPSFFVNKLWSAFVAGPPPSGTRSSLQSLYVRSGYEVRPVVEAILMHPRFYEGARIVKPPVVYIAGLLRALGRGIDTHQWGWISNLCGQVLFRPPNVAGWDEERWLDTATFRARWVAANYAIGDERALDPDGDYDVAEDPETAVARALAFWGRPSLSVETRRQLRAYAERCHNGIDREWQERPYRVLRQNALRMLIATSPDYFTC